MSKGENTPSETLTCVAVTYVLHKFPPSQANINPEPERDVFLPLTFRDVEDWCSTTAMPKSSPFAPSTTGF